MAGGKLEVQIGADKTDFDKKIKEVEFDIKELSKVKLDRLKLGLDTTEINAQIKDAKNNLNQLRTTVKDTGATIGGQFKQQTANGSNALLQFSRIAQDAPFGIIGIGNNLTATAEAFGALRNQTGSTGGALKALGASLAGSGGILLGVSLLTTGLTLLSQSGLSVSDVFSMMSGSFDKAKKSLDDVQAQAIKGSGAEIAELKALVSASSNVSLSMEDRLIAVNKLQETYPSYFGNLSKEKILNGEVADTTRQLTDAIIAKARATAFAQKIGENEAKIFELQQKGQRLVQDFSKGDGVFALLGGTNGGGLFKQQAQSIANEIDNLRKQNELFAKSIQESTNASLKLINGGNKTKIFNTPQVSGIGKTIIPAPIFDTLGIVTFNGQVDQFGNKLKGLPNTIKASLGLAQQAIGLETAKMAAVLQDFNDKANAIIQGSISETFAGFGQAIGDAISTGGSVLEAVGASLLSSLGGILVEMGKMAISIGVGLLGIKAALKSLNPATAIAAGVALVALGSFFSSKSRSIGNSIGGGSTSSNTGSGANNTSFTSGSFSARGDGGGTVVFEIAGQKLIGVLSNTLNANRRLGGSLQLG